MKLNATFWVIGSLLGGLAGCELSTGDDEGGGRVSVSGATGADAAAPDSGRTAADAASGGGGGDAASLGGSDAGPGSIDPTGSTAAGCASALTAPSACVLPDPLETASAAAVELATPLGCGSANAGLVDSTDTDVFRFKPLKADPVQVELAYRSDKTAELSFRVESQTEQYVAGNTTARTAPVENAVSYFIASGGFYYDVSVTGERLSGCQPYTVRVDAAFCTDDYEDNDTLESSFKTPWAADQTISIAAKSFPNEPDFYEFVPVKHDPVLLTGSYDREATSKADLNWRVTGSAQYVTGDTALPAGLTESWRGWVFPHSAGEPLQLEVSTDAGLCTPYTVKLEAAACTDAFEDNDTDKTAVVLPAQAEASATIISADDDYYSLSALPKGGLCTIKYSVPAGSAQQITARLYSASAQYITGGQLVTDGQQRTLTVQWNGTLVAGNLFLEAKNQECLPYTIQCIAQ